MLRNRIKEVFQFLNRSDGSLTSKVFRSGFWVVFASITLNFLSFFRNIILARLLVPEIFGLMGLCLMVIRGVELFTETGFSAALIHRQDNHEKAKETAFSMMVVRGIILALVVIFISPYMAEYYEIPEINILVRALALVLIINGFGNINLITQEKNLDYKKLTYLNQITTILDFTVVVTLAYFYRNVWALVVGQIFAAAIRMILSYIIIPGRPVFKFNKTIAKELFSYGKYITGLTIVLFIASEIDNAIIGKMLGMELLGYYVIAYMLANIPATHIAKVLSRVLFPAYCSLQNDFPTLRKAYLTVLKLLGSITIPAAAGIAILAPEIIRYVYGEKWLLAIIPLQILCVFGGCRSILAINGYLYNAIDKPNISLYMNAFRLFMIVLLIYPLTKAYGLSGASIAVTLPISVQLVLDVVIFTKILRLEKFAIITTVFPILLNTFIMLLALVGLKFYFSITNVYALLLFVVVGAFVYIILNIKYILSLKHQVFSRI